MRLNQAALPLFALIATAAPLARATPSITVGSLNLLPNTANQVVTLVVSGGDNVTGFNLRAQINDGTGPSAEPIFQSIAYTGGTIWDTHPVTVTGGPVNGAPQDAQSSVVFNNSGDNTAAAGNFVKMTISTVGFNSGSFPLKLAATEILSDSNFIGVGTQNIPATITNGSITITPVPEPSCPLLLGAAVGQWARRRKR